MVSDERKYDTGDILIVDDNPVNLNLLTGMLQEHAYHIRVATNGKRALIAAASCVPDLILLDINMPEMDGFEVCRRLKENEHTREVPVIFISALDEAIDKVKAFRSGGVDYVTKPFQIEEVLARIENQLKISRLQRQLVDKNAELNRNNDKLRELDAIKANFTAMLVHDLKSPLSVIKGVLEMFEIHKPTLEPLGLDELVAASNRSVDKMITLINEVLEVFRTDQQTMKLTPESLDPAKLFEEIAAESAVAAVSKRLAFQVDIPDHLPTISADRGKIERVFSNLLSNAIKFTAEGGIVTMAVATVPGSRANGQRLEVSVSDTGPGISEADLPYIFDPYRQASNDKTRLGVGLGLAIVRRIVTAHGGDISVASQEGVGSTFTVTLPALESVVSSPGKI